MSNIYSKRIANRFIRDDYDEYNKLRSTLGSGSSVYTSNDLNVAQSEINADDRINDQVKEYLCGICEDLKKINTDILKEQKIRSRKMTSVHTK